MTTLVDLRDVVTAVRSVRDGMRAAVVYIEAREEHARYTNDPYGHALPDVLAASRCVLGLLDVEMFDLEQWLAVRAGDHYEGDDLDEDDEAALAALRKRIERVSALDALLALGGGAALSEPAYLLSETRIASRAAAHLLARHMRAPRANA